MAVAKRRTVADRIKRLHPCEAASLWAASYTSPLRAWKACHRAAWMLWILFCAYNLKPSVEKRRRIVRCMCEMVHTSLRHTHKPSRYGFCLPPLRAAERWSKKKSTPEEVEQIAKELWASDLPEPERDYRILTHACCAACFLPRIFGSALFTDDFYSSNFPEIIRKHFPHPPRIPLGQ